MIQKLFGGIKMTWKKVILSAILAGAFTAAMALWVPDGNSFHEIAVSFEAWVLFAILIVVNCDTPLDAALKTFVFFLISQPLVYLFQVPFNSMGFRLFYYYDYWFIWTLLTLPGAYIAWYIRKDNVLAALILCVALVFLILLGMGYLKDTRAYFPRHIVSTVFCFGLVPLLILAILKRKSTRLIAAGICLAAVIVLGMLTLRGPTIRENRLVDLDPEKYPLDPGWTVQVEDEKISTARILDFGDECTLEMFFFETKPNVVILTDPDGTQHRLTITYDIDDTIHIEE